MARTALPLSSQHADMSRRERRKLEVRGRMLEASADLFRLRGYHATTVAEICDRADVARKTFFNHFATKQQVVRELAGFSVEQVLVDIEETRKAEPDTRSRLLRFFEHVARNVAADGAMSREFTNELIHAVQESGEERENAQRVQAAFADLVAEGLARGEVTQRHSPVLIADMIIAVYYQLILNWVHRDDYPIESKAQEAARFLADAIAPATDSSQGRE